MSLKIKGSLAAALLVGGVIAAGAMSSEAGAKQPAATSVASKRTTTTTIKRPVAPPAPPTPAPVDSAAKWKEAAMAQARADFTAKFGPQNTDVSRCIIGQDASVMIGKTSAPPFDAASPYVWQWQITGASFAPFAGDNQHTATWQVRWWYCNPTLPTPIVTT